MGDHTVNAHEASLVHARPDVAIIGELRVAVCTTAQGEAERVPRDEQFTWPKAVYFLRQKTTRL